MINNNIINININDFKDLSMVDNNIINININDFSLDSNFGSFG